MTELNTLTEALSADKIGLTPETDTYRFTVYLPLLSI